LYLLHWKRLIKALIIRVCSIFKLLLSTSYIILWDIIAINKVWWCLLSLIFLFALLIFTNRWSLIFILRWLVFIIWHHHLVICMNMLLILLVLIVLLHLILIYTLTTVYYSIMCNLNIFFTHYSITAICRWSLNIIVSIILAECDFIVRPNAILMITFKVLSYLLYLFK